MIEGADLVGSCADRRVGRSAALPIPAPAAPAAGCWVALERHQLLDRLGSTPVPEAMVRPAGCWARPAGLDRLVAGPKGPDRPKPAVAGRFRPPDHPITRTASAFPSLGLVSLK